MASEDNQQTSSVSNTRPYADNAKKPWRLLDAGTVKWFFIVAVFVVGVVGVCPWQEEEGTTTYSFLFGQLQWSYWHSIERMSVISSIMALLAAWYIVMHQNAGTATALDEQRHLIEEANHMALNNLLPLDPIKAQRRVMQLFSEYKVNNCLYVSNYSKIPHFWHNEGFILQTKELFCRYSEVKKTLYGPKDADIRQIAETIANFIVKHGTNDIPDIGWDRVRTWILGTFTKLKYSHTKLDKGNATISIPQDRHGEFITAFSDVVMDDYQAQILSFNTVNIATLDLPDNSTRLNFVMIEIAETGNYYNRRDPTRFELIAFADFHEAYKGLDSHAATQDSNAPLPSVLIKPQVYSTTNPVALCSILDLDIANKVFS